MAVMQGLVSVSYRDLSEYQIHYKEAIKQVGKSSGKIIYLSSSSQLVWGFICLSIGIIALVRSCDQSGMRIGIWSGVMYMFCGTVGLFAAANTNVAMCYLLASMMTLSISITSLCLEGQHLTQSILDNVAYECVGYSSGLVSFSAVESITAVTAIILSYMIGRGTVSHLPLPDLQVFVKKSADRSEALPPVMTRTTFASDPLSQPTKQFL